jgi:hypothetical protein
LRNNNRKNNRTDNKKKGDNKKKPVFLPGEANEGGFKGQVVADDDGPLAGKFRSINNRKFFNYVDWKGHDA